MKCPLLKKKCWQHECEWYMAVPLSENGIIKDHFMCAIPALAVLSFEQIKKGEGTRSAVESLRNVVSDDNQRLLAIAAQAEPLTDTTQQITQRK